MSRWNAELQAPAPAPAPVAPAPSPAPSEGAGDVPAHRVVSGWLTRSSSPELEQGVQPEWAKEAHKDMICEHCGLQGHVKRHCPKRYTLTKEQQERKDAVDDYKAGGQKAKEELDKIQPEGWGELGSDPLASSSSPTSGCTPRNAHSRAARCGFADTVHYSRRVGKAAAAERCGDAGSGLSTGPGLAGARHPGRRPSEASRGLVGQHQREADLHALPAVWRVQIRRPLPILARPRQCGLARSSRQCRVRRCRIRRRRSRRDLRRTRRTHGGRRTRPVGACCWADESG